jgi:hypothetical protein
MILLRPPIIIIWTYQDMMEWMSRMLVGEMWLVLMRILTWKLGKCGWLLFKPQPYTWTQHDQHGPLMILLRPSIIIIWTYQDMMEWMSRMLVGEMRLVLMRFLTWKLGKCG